MKLTKKSIPAILLGLFALGILFPAYKDSLVVESHTLFILLMVSRVLLVLLLLSAMVTLYLLKREDIFHFQLRIGFVALFILDAAVFFLRAPDDPANVFISILLLLLGYLAPLERSLKLATLLPYSVALVLEVVFYKELDFFTKGSIALVIGVENLVGLLSMRRSLVIDPPSTASAASPSPECATAPEPKPEPEKETEKTPTTSREPIESLLEERIKKLPLSEREKEVVVHMLEGETRASIAAKMFVSEETVKKHVANIYAKLKISCKSELFDIVLGKNGKP